MLNDRRLTIRNQLLGSFLVVIVFVVATGAVGYWAVDSVGASADRIVEEDVVIAEAAIEMNYAIEAEESALRGYLLDEHGEAKSFEAAVEHFNTWEAKLESRELTPDQREQVEAMAAVHEDRVVLAREAIAAHDDGDHELAMTRLHEVEDSTETLESEATAFAEYANEDMAASLAADHRIQRNAELGILGLSALAFLAASGIGLVLSRRLSGPIRDLRGAAAAISRGDFGEQATVEDLDRDDELADMTAAFGEMRENLQQQVADLKTVSRNLEHGRLDDDVRTDLPGEFGDIMTSVASGMAQLDASFEQIGTASEDLREGSLEREFETDMPGEYGVVLAELDDGMANFERSLTDIDEASTALQAGDLTVDVRTDLPGVYGSVMRNLDASIGTLERDITDVRRISVAVADESDEVASGAEEIESASGEVARTIEQISAGAEQQHDNLDQVATEMTDLSATVEEIASSADEVAQTSTTAAERGETGKCVAGEGLDAMAGIEDSVDETVRDMAALESEIGQINDVVELIDDIAEQVNMLALNASIEAARAGEAGEGFAVVASEIKSLAEETARATGEVESLADGVQSSAVETADEMAQMRDRVENGLSTVEEGLGALEDIVAAVEDANGGVQSINDATDQQAASSQEVVAMVDEVTAVSQQTSAEAQNVSAAAEEQTAAITQIATNAESMADRATRLEAFVDRFELDTDGAVTGDTAGDDGKAAPTTDVRADTSLAPGDTEPGARATQPVRSTGTGEVLLTDTDVYDESAADAGPDRLEPGDIELND